MALSEGAPKDPWAKYQSGVATTPASAPMRLTLPADIGLIIRQNADHYNLTPEQIVCAAIAVGVFDHRAWIAAMMTLRLAAYLPTHQPTETAP